MIMNSDLQRAQLDQADAEKQLAMLRQLAKTGAASEGEIAAAEHRLAFEYRLAGPARPPDTPL